MRIKMLLQVIILLTFITITIGQNYEVAEIDCAVGNGGKELLTARLRRPDGFRGTPIFADDRNSHSESAQPRDPLNSLLFNTQQSEAPCQIFQDPLDTTARVFILRVLDFSQCGVLKRDGFINVRIWFPQLPGVVMLSDQEVIIMCKPPQPTITQSKAAGFAGSIPKGPRITGVVEERPGQLEYEVALFRETVSSASGRSIVSGGAYVTGIDSQELPVDQAVPIGTKLQLRAKISPSSAWQHAKLLDVSVSPDPKNPTADGSVALVKNGCRNPDLASIIPKQPYRYKERTNEVVLDFEAFLLSNMGERNTLWLHTQIKACMESMDCESEVCIMDIYQPSSYGRKKRSNELRDKRFLGKSNKNETVSIFSSPLLRHWKTIEGPTEEDTKIESETQKPLLKINRKMQNRAGNNTNFGDNLGFSVIMPPDYYRSGPNAVLANNECKGWFLGTVISLLIGSFALILSCFFSYKLKNSSKNIEKTDFFYDRAASATPLPSSTVWSKQDDCKNMEKIHQNKMGSASPSIHKQHHHHHSGSNGTKYARDAAIYRP